MRWWIRCGALLGLLVASVLVCYGFAVESTPIALIGCVGYGLAAAAYLLEWWRVYRP